MKYSNHFRMCIQAVFNRRMLRELFKTGKDNKNIGNNICWWWLFTPCFHWVILLNGWNYLALFSPTHWLQEDQQSQTPGPGLQPEAAEPHCCRAQLLPVSRGSAGCWHASDGEFFSKIFSSYKAAIDIAVLVKKKYGFSIALYCISLG